MHFLFEFKDVEKLYISRRSVLLSNLCQWDRHLSDEIGGVMINSLVSTEVDRGCSSPSRVKPKTMKLVITASLIITHIKE